MTAEGTLTPSERTAATTAVRTALDGIRPLVTMSRDGLVLIALEGDRGVRAKDYLTIDEAANGGLEILELGTGTVPAVEAATAKQPVVVFAGDTIVGGKQNRVVNVTIWLPAAKKTAIPVTCLEQGRWNQGSRFGVGRKADYALRAMLNRTVAERTTLEMESAPQARPSYAANQGAVWHEVGERQHRAGFRSSSSAIHELYEREAAEVRSLVEAFPVPNHATGVAVAVGSRIAALEHFDTAETLATQWSRLVEGAASAHLDHKRAVAAGITPPPKHRHPDDGALGRMLSRATKALDAAAIAPSVGEGTDVRLRGHRVSGAALVRVDRVVHLELFRADD